MRSSFLLAALVLAPGLALAADNLPQMQVVKQQQLHRHPTLLGMLRRNNGVRRMVGLRPHRINPALTKAAQDHANYMAQTAQFSHYVNGGPQYRASKYGFKGGGVLENIAYGTTSIDGAFNMWQASPAHYASLASGTTEAGFGYAIGPSGQTYWVSVYGNVAPGDVRGWTEEEVLNAIAADAKRKAEEQNAAHVKPADSNVQQASGTEPAGNAPTANPTGNNAIGGSNAQPGNVQPAGK
jgi:hypothetical protein